MNHKVVINESEEGFSYHALVCPVAGRKGATKEEALENIQNENGKAKK